MTKPDIKKAVNYWIESAKYDFGVAKTLFEKSKHPYALFFCHLTLEKTLKAISIKKTKKQAMPIHNLARLAQSTEIDFSEEQLDFLTIVTQFNIQAGYQDYKKSFYKTATKEYTSEYLKKTGKMVTWLRKKL